MKVTAGGLQRDLDSARASASSTSTLTALEGSTSYAAQQVGEISRLLGELSDRDRIVDESYDQIADLGDERNRLQEDFHTLIGLYDGSSEKLRRSHVRLRSASWHLARQRGIHHRDIEGLHSNIASPEYLFPGGCPDRVQLQALLRVLRCLLDVDRSGTESGTAMTVRYREVCRDLLGLLGAFSRR